MQKYITVWEKLYMVSPPLGMCPLVCFCGGVSTVCCVATQCPLLDASKS